MYFLHKKLTHISTHKIYQHTVILCRTDGVCIQRATGSDEAADPLRFYFLSGADLLGTFAFVLCIRDTA